jgi:crotonobetainyl-CoA:carnitine CoA-transferase CaiB-like acyl-CoA transferase
MILYADYPGLGKIPLPGVPVKLSLTPGGLHSLAPTIGEHNKEVYCGLLGMSTEEFRQLKVGKII